MIAEMGDIIAAHSRARRGFVEEPAPGYIDLGVCECDAVLWDEGTERKDWDKLRAAHVAEELAKAGYGKLPAVGAEEEYDFGDPSPTFVSGAFVRAMDQAYAHLQPDEPKAPEGEEQHMVALGEIKARADEALAHQNADPSVDAEMAWRAVEDQARLIAALEAVQAGLSGLDEIFNGDSEDDEAIRAISDGLRVAMAEALAGREVGS